MRGAAAVEAAVVGRGELIMPKQAFLTILASVSRDEIRALLGSGIEDEGHGVLSFTCSSFVVVSPRGVLL